MSIFFGLPDVVESGAGRGANSATDVGDASGSVGFVGPDAVLVTTSEFADGIASGTGEGASAMNPDRISEAINGLCRPGLDIRA